MAGCQLRQDPQKPEWMRVFTGPTVSMPGFVSPPAFNCP